MSPKRQPKSIARPATVTIPELEQSKTAVLTTLPSQHSRRSYEYAIERFIAWYCSEPRLTFNRSVDHLEKRLQFEVAIVALAIDKKCRRSVHPAAHATGKVPLHTLGKSARP